jgi:hypothetical protein
MSLHAPQLYGLMAEFDQPGELLRATRRAHAEGYRKLDAYTPFPIEGLSEAVGFEHTRLPLIVLVAGLAGCAGGFLMQYYLSVIDYPINVAGRPLNSWPAFIPITFEVTILSAALAAVVGMIMLNGLPSPYHPVFNAPGFELASRNHFFLCIESSDPMFDRAATREFLRSLGSISVSEVPS